MKNITPVLEERKQAMLLDYPGQQELTTAVLGEITRLLQEDFDAMTRRSAKMNLIFHCVAEILEKARDQNVRKKYATDLLDIFLDEQMVSCMREHLGADTERYVAVLKGARSELVSGQWSDGTSKHWQRAIGRFL